MGFRFTIIPGLTLNLGKTGVSVSAGVPGARVTVGTHGARTTIGIPGTGLSHTTYTPHSNTDGEPEPSDELERLDALIATQTLLVHYIEAGQLAGPIPLFEVLSSVKHGSLPEATLIRHVGSDQWTAVPAELLQTIRESGVKTPERKPMADRLSDLKAAMEKQVFWFEAGEVKGPTDYYMILQLAEAGHLPLDTQVCPAGTEEWHELEVPLLATIRALKTKSVS